jgi:hypothetical protein
MGELLCQSSGILQFLARAVAEEKPTKDLVQYSRAERPMVAVHSRGDAGGRKTEMRERGVSAGREPFEVTALRQGA